MAKLIVTENRKGVEGHDGTLLTIIPEGHNDMVALERLISIGWPFYKVVLQQTDEYGEEYEEPGYILHGTEVAHASALTKTVIL